MILREERGRCNSRGGPITGTWGSVNMCYGSMEDDAGGFGKRLADGAAPTTSAAAGGLLFVQT